MLADKEIQHAQDEVALARSLTALLLAARLKVAEERKGEAYRLVLGPEHSEWPKEKSA